METRPDASIIDWLLAGDAALGWQTLRDLCGASPAEVQAERDLVATSGWGALLLSKQDSEGTWAHGLYTPKWTGTFYTLLLLRCLGLERGNEQAARGAEILLELGQREDGGLAYFGNSLTRPKTMPMKGRSETCISGMGLAILARFLPEVDALEPLQRYILAEQMPDGGWNCRRFRGAAHSSFHTTISVLDGLLELERRDGRLSPPLLAARQRGHEFLLVHSLFRSHTTGAVAHPSLTKFPFPPQWHYDALRGLDYLREVDAGRDPRMQPAIDLVLSKRKADGRWPAYSPYRGSSWVNVDPARGGGLWNTLRALRVLRWWQSG